jgi:hypothetical protein
MSTPGGDTTIVRSSDIQVIRSSHDHTPAPSREELLAIARRVLALVPSRTDPELYHLSKDEIVKTLRRWARQAEERAP